MVSAQSYTTIDLLLKIDLELTVLSKKIYQHNLMNNYKVLINLLRFGILCNN